MLCEPLGGAVLVVLSMPFSVRLQSHLIERVRHSAKNAQEVSVADDVVKVELPAAMGTEPLWMTPIRLEPPLCVKALQVRTLARPDGLRDAHSRELALSVPCTHCITHRIFEGQSRGPNLNVIVVRGSLAHCCQRRKMT